MFRFFITLYHFFQKRKLLLFIILTASISILAYFAWQLKMNEDIMNIIPKNETTDRVNFVFRNMNATDKIIVKLSQVDTSNGTDPDWLSEQAERLADSLQPLLSEKLIASLFYKTDESQMQEMLHFLLDNIPYFMNDGDYQRIDSMLTPQKIAETLQANKELLTSPIGMVYRDALLSDPLHLSQSLLKELGSFQVENQYITYNSYLFTKDEKGLMFFITPEYSSSDTYHSKLLINKLEAIFAHFNTTSETPKTTDMPALQLSYFGAAAVAVANADQIKKDSTYSMIIALIIIILILFLYFRNFKYLTLLLLPLLFGGLLSLAALYLIKGEISAIAIGTGAIILGIAIDYSLHFLIHLKIQPSVKQTLREIASPLIVGSTTTIAAFLCLIFLKSELLEDFGLFASFTLIGTILFTLIFLPHFTGKTKPLSDIRPHYSIWNRIAGYSFENNKYVIIGIVALTVLFSFFADNVRFEDDMNKINYMTKAQREAFAELSQNTTLSKQLTYFAATGDQLETALQNYEKTQPVLQQLTDNKLLLSRQGVGRLLPSQQLQQQQIARWNSFWKTRKATVIATLNREAAKCGFTAGSFARFETLLTKTFIPQPCNYFLEANKQLLSEFIINTPEKSVVLSLLYSDPKVTPQVEEQLSNNPANFCFDTKTLTRSMLDELTFDFNYLLWICCLIVLLFLFIAFGRIELTLLTFAPMAIAFIWILGMMAMFDIRFNIINVILTTFIFGIGDDYSIFIMEGLMYEYTYGKKMLTSYKTAVILSAVTMFVGIGALIIARHPAMFSLAQVTIIGMIAVAVIAYTVAPFIFKWLTMKKGQKRRMPVTLWNLTKTVISFLVFLVGSLLLTLIGFFLLTIGGKSKANKWRFHKCVCFVFKLLSKIMLQVPVKILNEQHENFEKPGIIICNHQSHLDLMYTLLLSPKIICLTNEWVWKSPFYGWILRYADFYPVANGIEQSVAQLQTAIDDGYSILIFPEGTRSADCSIGRFHKGAFYLAEKLQVDIIPLVVHGIGHFFPKNEFMSRKGRVTVQVLERIAYGDARRAGKEHYEIAKTMRRFYIEAYQQLAAQCETVSYFIDLVKHNYLYKGASVARAVRRSLKTNRNFEEAIAALPDEGSYHIDHCGYGEFPLLAALVKKRLQITASDPDEEKILLAIHCAAVPENLKYE
jgi:1-acyl-sn-glycerol-3-phosphate acyltransferase